jgi:DNA-binding response OmpR family regulator
MSAHIFLLEDDTNLSQTIEEFLEEEGYKVTCEYEGESAESILYEERFDLLLLDVNVPGINGFELLKSARESGNQAPAIFITSLDTLEDVENGYKSGCDDYIRKPFALKELLLRIQSLLKREFSHVASEQISVFEGITFDPTSMVLHVNKKEQTLQPKEARLLTLFLKRRGEVISHEVIHEALWSYDETPSEGALRTYIKNLRKLIGKDSIVSLKKLGYKLIRS